VAGLTVKWSVAFYGWRSDTMPQRCELLIRPRNVRACAGENGSDRARSMRLRAGMLGALARPASGMLRAYISSRERGDGEHAAEIPTPGSPRFCTRWLARVSRQTRGADRPPPHGGKRTRRGVRLPPRIFRPNISGPVRQDYFTSMSRAAPSSAAASSRRPSALHVHSGSNFTLAHRPSPVIFACAWFAAVTSRLKLAMVSSLVPPRCGGWSLAEFALVVRVEFYHAFLEVLPQVEPMGCPW
jgi:hypothetical protein